MFMVPFWHIISWSIVKIMFVSVSGTAAPKEATFRMLGIHAADNSKRTDSELTLLNTSSDFMAVTRNSRT